MIVLGVDPGQADTGLVVRSGREVLEADTFRHGVTASAYRTVGQTAVDVDPRDLENLGHRVEMLHDRHRLDVIAVESVRRPNPHLNRRNGRSVTDPGPIIATAIVLGAVTAAAQALGVLVVWVPPGRNGSNPLAAYPAELVSATERRHGLNRVGGGDLRHVRSAYDVAGHAVAAARVLRAATRA